MALVSPGVEVKVVDESFYIPAQQGTVPALFIATASNKPNGAGTGTASGTLNANAGIPYLITSQRDLVDTFGDPSFQIDNNNNPIHASELNEYGLQAAYSYLGIANAAWVVRADVDLSQIEASSTAPGSDPTDGAYWLDTSTTIWGVQEWNGSSILNGGQNFTYKKVIVITDDSQTENTGSVETNGFAGVIPSKGVGSVGSYAVVATSTLNKTFYRNSAGNWVLVGSGAWSKSWPTVKGSEVFTIAGAQAASFTITVTSTVAHVLSAAPQQINITTGDTAEDVATTINTVFSLTPVVSAAAVNGKLEIYFNSYWNDQEWTTMAIASTASADIDPEADIGFTDGAYYPPKLQISKHTDIPEYKLADTSPRPSGSVWVKITEPNKGIKLDLKVWNDAVKLWDSQTVNVYTSNAQALYNLDISGGGSNLKMTDIYMQTDVSAGALPTAIHKLMKRMDTGATTITSDIVIDGSIGAGTKSFTVQSTDNGTANFSDIITVTSTYNGLSTDSALLVGAINDANIPNVTATVTSNNQIIIKHSTGGEIKFVDTDSVLASVGFSVYVDEANGTPNLYYQQGYNNAMYLQASLWNVLTYVATDNQPIGATQEGQLWYTSVVDEIDILVHNGSEFVGLLYNGGAVGAASPYYNVNTALQTDPAGPIVSATMPLLQSDNTALVTGDLWVDTSDIDNYPKLYKFNAARTDLPLVKRWFELDLSDQTTEEGVLFADARYNTAGSNSDEPGDIKDLLSSDFVDPDSPDPSLYPKGMLLVNTRRSGFNVKKYQTSYIDTAEKNIRYNDESMSNYAPARWTTESGNQEDGSGTFGRHAQRKVVVQRLQAEVNSNQDIRDDESRLFNLLSCPGYPELTNELISLNYDRNLSAFIVADTPFRLEPNGTVLNNWATNVNLAVEDNINGAVTSDPYVAMYYPSGFTSDNFGNNVVVPASHMMLRTLALSDQISYPWFAPAGVRRGTITNASSTGYITDEGEFKAIALNEGLRDILYTNNVNPITFVTGAGLITYGQKTRQLTPSALDRINVARLIIYLRGVLKVATKPYLFEPNDQQTRDEVKAAIETIFIELVALRGIYDYLIVCDTSNNTPARIDRGELYIDIAIEPVKALEFIYIPLRIKNTGEISGL